MKAILHRRSIRKYKPDPLTPSQINTLLEAAMMAPSASNCQAWRFVACTDREIIDALHAVHPYSGMLAEAPVCIAVCYDRMAAPGLAQFWQQDCAAATENILIAAADIGLGTCWMGVAPNAEFMKSIRAALNLPDTVDPFNLIAIGYPNEAHNTSSRYDDSKVHWNGW